jgi:hypothetical protein
LVKRLFPSMLILVLLVGFSGPGRAQMEPPVGSPSLAAPAWLAFDWLEKQKSVRLAWNPVEGAFGYRILRGSAAWGELEQVGSTKNLRWFDEKTAPGASYRYAIIAYTREVEGTRSTIRTITVPAGALPVAAPVGVPAPEWVLTAGLLDTSGTSPAFRVHLVWLAPPVAGIVGYNIYRNSESGVAGVFLGARPATETRFVDQPAWEPGRTWYYSVRTIGPGFVQSDPSPERGVTLVARGEEGASRTRLTDRDATLLREALADRDPVVRQLAAETLADAEPIPSVVEALSGIVAATGADQAQRLTAIAGLGRMTDPGIFAPLVGALRDYDPAVRAAAVKAMERLGGEEAGAAFQEVLAKDWDAEVRGRAAEALAAFADDRTVEVLASALRDADPGVVGKARASLMTIAGADLGEDPAVWLDWLSQRTPR